MSISWLTVTYYAYWVVLVYVTLQIISQYTISSRASAWLFTIYVFPVVGVVLYFIFGVKRRKRILFKQKLTANQESLEAYHAKFNQYSLDLIKQQKSRLKQFHGLTKLIYRDGYSRLTVKNKLTLLENGEDKFPELFADIQQAKNTIHLEYYIFKFDALGSELVGLLVERAKAGVQVRFIYDDYGSLGLNQSVLQRMRSYGIEVWPFAEINLFAFTERLNYRNHRKIAIIDGEIAYVGGINVGDEYLNRVSSKQSQLYWRDSHLKIEGQGVSYLQNIFLNDWNFCTGQHITIEEKLLPQFESLPEAENRMLQVVASGPDSPQPTILFSILYAIHAAKTEILITTPYFIPNPSLIKALKIAVLSGVSVKILVPQHSDSWVVNKAAQSYYYELLQTGVEIYQYSKGFIHVKSMVVDSFLSIMGTANFDERSFELNFEVNVTVYDSGFAAQLASSFSRDIIDSVQLQLDSWENRSALKIFTEKIARLVSPIL